MKSYTLFKNIKVTEEEYPLIFELITSEGEEIMEKRLTKVSKLFEEDIPSAMIRAQNTLYQAGGDFSDGNIMKGFDWLRGDDIPNLTYLE
jgi:hypothetical protein